MGEFLAKQSRPQGKRFFFFKKCILTKHNLEIPCARVFSPRTNTGTTQRGFRCAFWDKNTGHIRGVTSPPPPDVWAALKESRWRGKFGKRPLLWLMLGAVSGGPCCRVRKTRLGKKWGAGHRADDPLTVTGGKAGSAQASATQPTPGGSAVSHQASGQRHASQSVWQAARHQQRACSRLNTVTGARKGTTHECKTIDSMSL